MDENELLFQMKMQDQMSGVLQGIEGSFKDVASVVQQQQSAMQNLTEAMQGQARAAASVNSATRSQVEGLKAVDSALQTHTKNIQHATEEHASFVGSMRELREGAEGLAGALLGIWASNEMIKAPIEEYREMEATIKKIGLAANASRGEVTELMEDLANLSLKDGKATVQQLEQMAVAGARMGGSVEQIKNFAEAVSKIAGGDAGVAGQISNILSASGEGIEGVNKLTAAIKVFGATARGGKDGIIEMTATLANFTAGMDIQSSKLAAYAATFDRVFGAQMGRRAAAQFAMTLQIIERQAKDGGAGLRDLAERFGQTYDEMRKLGEAHPDEVFNRILEVVARLKEAGSDPTQFLKEFGIGGPRAVQQMEALAAKQKELQKNIAIGDDPSKAPKPKMSPEADEFTKATNRMTTAWDEFKQQVGIDISAPVVAFFKTATVALTTFKAVVEATPAPVRMVIEALLILGPTFATVGRIATLAAGQGKAAAELFGVSWFSAGEKVSAASAEIVTAEEKIAVAAAETAAKVGVSTGEMAAETEVAASRMSRAMTVTANLARGAFAGIMAGFSVAEAGNAIGDSLGKLIAGYRRGVGVKDFGNAMMGLLPSALGGDYFENNLKQSLQAKKDAGTLKWDFSKKPEEEGEGHEVKGDELRSSADNGDRDASREDALKGSGEYAREQLKGFNDAIKGALELRDAEQALKDAVDLLDDAQKEQFKTEIAGAQQALALRRAALDPLNKMADDWRQAMMSARAYTKAQQEAAAIEKQVFDARQEAYKRGEGDAGANRAEQFVRTTAPQTNRAQSDTAYAKEAEGMYRALAASTAVTQSEKDRLAVEQQIAKWQQDTSYTQAQIAQLTKILELTKAWERELQQMQSLNPQASAISKYNDDLAVLNKRLQDGRVSQQEFNREKSALDQQTLAQRDPLGNIAQQNQEELAQLQITGKYRDADVKTLQQINELKHQGIVLDEQQKAALSGSNRALQDVMDAQAQMQELTQTFGSSLSTAISQAFEGNRHWASNFGLSIGKAMTDMAIKNVMKSLDFSGMAGNALFGSAKAANDNLAKAGASQMATTMASAQQEIASAQINIANATMAAGLTAQGAGANGVPGALPAPAGTNLPGSTGAAATPNPSRLAQVISPGTAAANAPTVPAVTDTGITNVPSVVAGGAAAVAGAAGAGAVAKGLPSTLAGGAFGTSTLTPQIAAPNGIGSINPSQFSQAFPTPSLATSTVRGALPSVSAADTERFTSALERAPTPGDMAAINKFGVEHAITLSNNPSMKVQDTQWWHGDKDWKSYDPNMTNRDYLKSLEPKDTTATTLSQPNPSFPQNGVGGIGDPSAMMKLPQQMFGAMKDGAKEATQSIQSGAFGDLSAAKNAFGGGQTSVFGAGSGRSLADYRAGVHPDTAAISGGAGGPTSIDPQTLSYLQSHAAGAGVNVRGLDPQFAQNLSERMQAAEAAGFHPQIQSGYRSVATQQKLYDDYINGRNGQGLAAPPGHSLHNYGRAADVADPNVSGYGASAAREVQYRQIMTGGQGDVVGVGHGTVNWRKDPNHFEDARGFPDQTSSLDAIKSRQGVDMTQTGAINSAAKQAQQVTQQQSQMATEQFTKMQQQVQSQLQTTTQGFGQNFQALSGGIRGAGQTALGAVPDMGSFSNSISEMVSKLGSAGGGGGGGFGGLGGLFGGGGGGGFGDFADFAAFHTGGKVGSGAGNYLHRTVSASLFRTAPKFHDGLNSDEFPAVLQRGERVLTNAQEQKTTSIVDKLANAVQMSKGSPNAQHVTPAAQRAAGSRINMVVNVKDANSFRLSQSQIMAQAHSATMRSAAKNH